MLPGYYKLEIEKFRSCTAAQDYIKFQRTGGVAMKAAQVRMRKYSDHKWANRVGNVPVIKQGRDQGGDVYLFDDGYSRNECFEGLNKFA